MVDCLNHTVKKTLVWKNSVEILNGDMADISEFRYIFWKPIEYYNPSTSFTYWRGKNYRFLNIFWDTGNQFISNSLNGPYGRIYVPI